MLFAPKPVGNLVLRPDVLAEDKKHCRKIGPCGIGKEAIYLNSFFIDRRYYVTFTDVRRCFKRVAMSRGGFTGKGIFSSMPYLVVLLSNGQEKQCNFKYEEDVDRFLAVIAKEHPEIPVHSKKAEQRLSKAAAEQEAKYVKDLSPAAQASIDTLTAAKEYLEKQSDIGTELSAAAKFKRSMDGIKTSNLVLAGTIAAAAAAAVVAGVVLLFRGKTTEAMYFFLGGFSFLFFIMGSHVLPGPRNNKKVAQKRWDEAVKSAEEYIGAVDTLFPVPACYAHPVVLTRMIRLIREGRATDIPEALDVLKEDLRQMDHTKHVTQEEYDEIVAIKPMFLVEDYQ